MSLRTLPSRPTPRSRSTGRNSDDGGYDSSARPPLPSGTRIASSQSLRTQSRTNPLRDDRRIAPSPNLPSGSSFLDRMKETSSRRSTEEEYGGQRKRTWAPRETRSEYGDQDDNQDSDSEKPLGGYGTDLWSRVTAAAGTLTINVSKAWEKGISTVDGEETPPGQESRLTKAMKAYHLNRARSPTDLPAWLFDETERRGAPRSWNLEKRDNYEDRFRPEAVESRQKSSLRDIYDKAAASSASVSSPRREPEGGGQVSGAANRLKSIREAKRSAQRQADSSGGVDDRRQISRRDDDKTKLAPARRVGLPSSPGRIPRA